MAASGWGPPPNSWGDRPPDTAGNYVDGSFAGPTLPAYMDHEQLHGELHLLRISGVNGPLPNAPFMIRRSIQNFVGRIEGAFPEANRASYALKVRSEQQFNKLLTMTALMDGTPVAVAEHPTLNSTRCVVSCRDVISFPENELLEELKDQGVKEVRRITRKAGAERENTPAIILTCRGTIMPEHMDFGFIRCRTRPYYPSPMQCFNCWAFGHTRLRCRSKNPICGKCSEEHPIAEDRTCNKDPFCKQCNSTDHQISSRSCPQYRKENAIQRVKVDQGVSYPTARRIVEQNTGGRTYANTVDAANQSELARLNEKVDKLTGIVERKDTEIAELRAALTARQAQPAQIEEIEALKALVKQQAKQIEALTEQLTVFLRMVMPAGQVSFPKTIPTATTPKTADKETTSATSEKEQQASTPAEEDPYLDEIFSDSDVTPDTSPNLTPTNDTPRPQNSQKSQKIGSPQAALQKTPKRPLTAGSELPLAQRFKKSKHKNTSNGPGTLGKR